MQPKRLLVISNACFFNANSNGRTLAKLFDNYDKSSLAQFFVYGTPDFTVCKRYYQVTDREALLSCLLWKETGGVFKPEMVEAHDTYGGTSLRGKRVKKTPLNLLLREVAWKLGRWNGNNLKQWIEEFGPEVIFVSVAANPCLCRLARQIAKRYHIPVCLYSTESYYFMGNYLTKRLSVFYALFRAWLRKSYKSLQKYVRIGVFNTPLLQKRFEEEFTFPCTCVYSPSDIDFQENISLREPITISYLGNLQWNRHLALMQLAEVLRDIIPGVQLNIYGKIPNEQVRQQLLGCAAVRYCGIVPYDQVVEIIHKSTLVVHAEWNDPETNENIRYGFTTKIADSVCSGTPFLAFAHKGLAGIDFLLRNQCAFVAETEEELREQLKLALFNEDARRDVVENAKITREKYFQNSNAMVRIINEEM